MPKLKHTFDIVNPKTQVSNHIVLEGLSSFFDWPYIPRIS